MLIVTSKHRFPNILHYFGNAITYKALYFNHYFQQKVVDLIENQAKEPNKRCKRNLLELQRNKSTSQSDWSRKKWKTQYQMALTRAVYSHNWDRLLYLLKKSPIWEHNPRYLHELPIYIRVTQNFFYLVWPYTLSP